VVIESTSASLPPARPLSLLGSRLENAILAGWQKILDRNAQENCVNGWKKGSHKITMIGATRLLSLLAEWLSRPTC